MWIVKIVEDETGELVETIECKSERDADRVEDGVNINLNHDKYTTYAEEI